MEFLGLSGKVVGDIAWPRQTSTSDELKPDLNSERGEGACKLIDIA